MFEICCRLVLVAALLPFAARAQTPELLAAYSGYENAKAAGKSTDALAFGAEALTLTEHDGDARGTIEVMRDVGDYAAATDHDAEAATYLDGALNRAQALLGPMHPDLVPLLTALAGLAEKGGGIAQAVAFERRILDIERLAYGEHHDNVVLTLRKLRELQIAAGDAAGAAGTATQLQSALSTQRGLAPRRDAGHQGFAAVRVFYGTNRAPSGNAKPAAYYGNARGPLQYGYLDVTIPAIHKEAELETQPRWAEYVFDAAESRNRYVLLERVTPLARDAFTRALQQQVKVAKSKDVFVFVHGFNNSFEDAARRAAQLAYDLDFDGTPVLYSWPSQGSATAYAVDEAAVGISGRKMADFLDTIVANSGARRIHVLAHSMGNRALLEALQTYLAKRAPDDRQHLFGQIVFTAPDVDRDYFMDAVAPLRNAADRVTLYASNNDYALRSSQLLHGAPRAGTAGDVIVRLAGLDSIDMSSVPADMLGHSYFAANAGAIFDIFRLLWRGDAPPQRCGMSGSKSSAVMATWVFNAEICKGDDLLQAGVILKRYGDLARQHVMADMAGLTDPSQKQHWSLVLGRLDGLLATAAPAR